MMMMIKRRQDKHWFFSPSLSRDVLNLASTDNLFMDRYSNWSDDTKLTETEVLTFFSCLVSMKYELLYSIIGEHRNERTRSKYSFPVRSSILKEKKAIDSLLWWWLLNIKKKSCDKEEKKENDIVCKGQLMDQIHRRLKRREHKQREEEEKYLLNTRRNLSDRKCSRTGRIIGRIVRNRCCLLGTIFHVFIE